MLTLEAPSIAKEIAPGQFMHVKCSDGPEPLLRKPLSLHRVRPGCVEIFYEVVGRGTELLAKKKAGEMLDVIGPLGKGFDIKTTDHGPRTTDFLMAGGMGVAPLVSLAEKLMEIKNQKSKVKTMVLIGAKTKKDILCEKDFKKLGCEVKVATDDGSKGFKGFVTDLLRETLSRTPYAVRRTIYACGPNIMLKEVARIAHTHKIPCQVSLEEYMACGVGVCLGCPVKIRTPYAVRRTQYEYKMVCKDGPVFNAEEIVWED